MKRTYVTPAVDKLIFDYRNVVTASATGGNSQCLPDNHNKCEGWRKEPGGCYADVGLNDASHCIGL